MTELGESVLTLQLSRASAIPHVYVSERTKAKVIAAFCMGLVLQYSCSNEKKTDTGAQLLQTGIRVFLSNGIQSTRTQSQLVPSQLVPKSTRTHGQLVPKSTRTHGQLVPKSTRTQGQLVPKYKRNAK